MIPLWLVWSVGLACRAFRRGADDLVERSIVLKANAAERGFGTLAYFLETALIEARLQTERIAEEHETGKRLPAELWRPKSQRE